MTRSRNKQVDEIFQSALDLPPGERRTFIDKASGGDTSIAVEVSELLDATAGRADIDESIWSAARDRLLSEVFSSDDDIEDLTGSTIGRWSIRRRVARGGLATVYVADRSDGEFVQRAALKVLRRGLDTDDLISRFRAERQILSSLDHPSIAGILDGGAIPDGRPYLVLEFVDGVSITDYCVAHDTSVAGKIALIIDVLRALQHAHTRLVVHRDVKPSNILVTHEGRVILLDFGIAKILDPSAMPGASTATRTGISLLTPGYGSPEQHAGADITTASDIYQCGIVLHELLTGKRVGTPDSDLQTVRTGHPDLNAIVAKAAAGDPAQRYASADDMRRDLQNFLEGRPISARPATLAYRITKLARRQPWLLPAIVLTTLAISAYVATITVYSKQLEEEQRIATASQQFLVDLFRSPDPFNPASATEGRDISVIEALDVGRSRIASELLGQPRLQATLYGSIADVYGNLDRNDEAIQLREAALDMELEIYGARSPQVAASMRELAPLYRWAGATAKAKEYSERQLSLAKDVFAGDSAELGLAYIAMGIDLYHAGDLRSGRAELARGIKILRPHKDRYPNEMIDALIIYAQNLGFDRKGEAFDAIHESDDIAVTAYGEDSLQRASARIRLASTMTLVGEYESSEANFLAAMPVMERHLGRDHSATVAALSNFSFLMMQSGDLNRAEPLFLDLLTRQRSLFGERSRQVADSSQNLGAMYARQGRFADAIEHLARAHDIYSSILNDGNYVIGFPLLTLAYSYIELDRPADAEPIAREALAIFKSSLPDTHLHGVAQCLTGVSLEYQGKHSEGKLLVEASHAHLGKGEIGDHYRLLCRYPP